MSQPLLDGHALTVVPAKRTHYREEPAFMAGLDDAIRRTGTDSARLFQAHCITIVKPEGIAGARLAAVVDFARTMDFRLVDAATCHLAPNAAEITWRYQMNAATEDRAALAFAMMDASSSLALLWRQDSGHELPASVRMAAHKGAAEPARRDASDLRSVLGSPNRVITFVHIPDEPIDVVRDMTYLLPEDARHRFFASMPTPGDVAESALADEPRTSHPALTGLSAGSDAQDRVVEAITAALRGGRCPEPEKLDSLCFDLVEGGAPVGWPRIEDALQANDVSADFWDRVRVASDRGVHDRARVEKLISDSGLQGWVDGIGDRHG